MKSKPKVSENLQKLSFSIGDFIRYWGFRRVHGAIWTQLYLSKTPLSCTDLTRKLQLSKALISPALEELLKFQLIREAPSVNDKTKLYEANENIDEIIKEILQKREKKILNQISQDFLSLSQHKDSDASELRQDRLESLGQMILSANMMLELLLLQKDLLETSLAMDDKI